MTCWKLLASAALLLCFAGAAQAHFDITPVLQDGVIVTSGHDDATGENQLDLRVFGYDFQEEIEDPYFIGDPGFNAPAGGLTPGASLRFNVLSSLQYWNGAGDPAFLLVSDGTTLQLIKGTFLQTISGDNGFQAGFAIGNVVSSGAGAGSLHVHLGSSLIGPDGPYAGDDLMIGTPDDHVAPLPGIYAFQMELYQRIDGLDTNISAPFWIVYNNAMSEETHDAAMAALASPVPEPASLALLAAGVPLLTRRRRH